MEEGKVNEIRATNYANTEITEERTPKTKGISYLVLGITIYISVSAAILVTDAAKWAATMYMADITIESENQKARAELKIKAERQETENRNRAARDAEIARQQESYQAEQQRAARANRIRNENAAEAQRKRMETCQYWITEFNKSRAEVDRNHRNNACRDAGTPFN
jgi:hypothetical protein